MNGNEDESKNLIIGNIGIDDEAQKKFSPIFPVSCFND